MWLPVKNIAYLCSVFVSMQVCLLISSRVILKAMEKNFFFEMLSSNPFKMFLWATMNLSIIILPNSSSMCPSLMFSSSNTALVDAYACWSLTHFLLGFTSSMCFALCFSFAASTVSIESKYPHRPGSCCTTRNLRSEILIIMTA